jgi:hypothetical protein
MQTPRPDGTVSERSEVLAAQMAATLTAFLPVDAIEAHMNSGEWEFGGSDA